jgi:hypothetical protein
MILFINPNRLVFQDAGLAPRHQSIQLWGIVLTLFEKFAAHRAAGERKLRTRHEKARSS